MSTYEHPPCNTASPSSSSPLPCTPPTSGLPPRYCPRCKEHRQASKKLDLWRLPEVLVVHLKRFSYSRFFKNKLDTLVEYPLRDLDLTAYLPAEQTAGQGALRYDLYAISNHFGGMGGGHYTAYGKVRGEGGEGGGREGGREGGRVGWFPHGSLLVGWAS